MTAPVQSPQSGSGRQLLQNSLLLLGIEAGSKLLGLIFFILLARYLGARDLGLYATAVAWANLLVLLPKFGLETLVGREVGRRPTAALAYWRQLSLLKAGLMAVALLGLAGVFRLLFPAHWLLLWLLGSFVCAYSFLEFFNAFFRALGRAAGEVWGRLWFSCWNLGLGTLVLWRGGRLPAVAGTQFLSVLSSLAFAGWLLHRWIPRRAPVVLQESYPDLLRRAAPFAGITVALFCSNQAGVLLLSLLQPEKTVGYLAAGLRLFDNLTLLPAAVMGAFLPVASREYHRSLRAFVLTCRFTLKYLIILGAPVAAGLLALARSLVLVLYRQDFLPAAAVLQLLAPALLCSFWNYLGDHLLIARNREHRLVILAWLAAALHVGANALLIPRFAQLGAAAATLVTQAGYSMILLGQLWRYLGGRQLLGLVGRPIICASVMGVVVWWLQTWPLPLVIGGGAGIYLLLLGLTRTLSRQEWQYVQALWRREPVALPARG